MYEASKQCERAYVPECFEVTDLEIIVKKSDCKILAFCERFADISLHEYCEKNPIQKDDNVVVFPNGKTFKALPTVPVIGEYALTDAQVKKMILDLLNGVILK